MLTAVTDPDNAEVKAALEAVGSIGTRQVPGPSGKRRGHNAPANNDDDDVFTAFEDVVTSEEMPEEFK
jgi:hypothetical protein